MLWPVPFASGHATGEIAGAKGPERKERRNAMRIPLSAAAAALLVAAGVAAALLWPDAGPDGRPGGEQAEPGGIARETAPDREDPAWEMRAKERIVERDAELTARLCSRQCAADLAAMAAELSRLPASGRP